MWVSFIDMRIREVEYRNIPEPLPPYYMIPIPHDFRITQYPTIWDYEDMKVKQYKLMAVDCIDGSKFPLYVFE